LSAETLCLVEVPGAVFTSFHPDQVGGLFRTFADLREGRPADIIAFANRYGVLGEGAEIPEFWQAHAQRMRTIIEVSDGLHAGDWRCLERTLKGAEGVEIPRLRAHEQDSLVEGAFAYLRAVFGSEIELTPGLLSGGWNAQAKRPVLYVRPPTLLRCLYLQALRAVLDERSYRQCPACRRWFELGRGAERADRTICSASCRVKLYRDRQQQARALRRKGRTLKQISKELGSDMPTIKKWVSRGKG
jgi:hypothetical protein